MKVEQIKKMVPKPIKKVIKGTLKKENLTVDNEKNLSVVNDSVNAKKLDSTETEYKKLVEEQKSKRKNNKNFDIRATYVEYFRKPLKNQIIVIGSNGGSFSGTVISKFAEIINSQEMDVFVALDKLTDPFP